MRIKIFLNLLLFLLFSAIVTSQEKLEKVPGSVVDYSNPETRIYLGSPSIVILPNSQYLATHDYFGPGVKGDANKTAVLRSSDMGKTWKKVTVLTDSYWSNLFYHKNAVYLMGTSKEYGNLVIRKSNDNGKTWSTPSDKKNGLLRDDFEYHTAPTPVAIIDGRIFRTMEVRSPAYGWGINFEALVVSAPVDGDLLDAENWTVSNRIHFNQDWLGSAWLEGNIVKTPEGKLVNIMRVDSKDRGGKAAILSYDKEIDHLSFDPEEGFINFPGGSKKFTIRYDEESKRYWTLSNHVRDFGYNPGSTRNCLTLSSSPDLFNWTVHEEILYHPDVAKHGFQYADWQFDGKDIIALVRTAFDDNFGGAHNNHDANYMTFHRIENFSNTLSKSLATYTNDTVN